MHNNLGIVQKRLGDVEQAENSYKEALKQEPKSFFPNYNLAVLLASEGQYQESVTYFKQALGICHSDEQHTASYEINVLINLALCFEQLKKYEYAVEFLESALQLQPKHQVIP